VIRAALVAVAVFASSAAAQSKRYPPEPRDRDKEAEAHSDLWEGTLDPELRPYADAVREAEQLVGRNTPADTKLALEKLSEAIRRVPDQPDAYITRGRIYLAQRDWPHCAEDLAAGDERAVTAPDAVTRTRNRIDLAVCQGRAGKLADAERTLVRASANAPAYRGELGLRLGETRIALGKLDEAIDALSAALDSSDVQHHLTRWLLTAAYDRARRPAEAAEQADLARRMDPQRTYIEAPGLPFLGAADQQYLLGVAYRYGAKPEYALLYFREFVRLAPDSPWRRRADEHVRDLTNLALPANETTSATGSSTVKREAMREALQGPMKSLRQCVAALPSTAFQVVITKAGPRTPETARDRPLYRIPASGVKATVALTVGQAGTREQEAAAAACLEKAAARIRMPAATERDTYYMVGFFVVSP